MIRVEFTSFYRRIRVREEENRCKGEANEKGKKSDGLV
jgi:hypothetical protein